MYWHIAYFVLSLIVANFWIWRQMRLEYESAHIFEVAFWLSLIAIGGLWWPMAAVGAVTGLLVLYSRRLHIDFWQWWDTVLPIGLLLFAPLAPWRIALSMVGYWTVVALVARFYRRFTWYTSGRMGLVGSVACVAWALVQLELAMFSLLWVYLAVLVIVAAATNIYIRSGHKLWLPKRNHPNQ